jgi:hypothetical protein
MIWKWLAHVLGDHTQHNGPSNGQLDYGPHKPITIQRVLGRAARNERYLAPNTDKHIA